MTQIRYYGDPILRQRAVEVEEIDDGIRELVADLKEMMRIYHGCGMAANQAGQLVRVFVARLDYFAPDGSVVEGETIVCINPKLSDPSEGNWTINDGCCSIPGVRVPIERPNAITLEALDLDGKSFTRRLEGLPAAIVCHENDHINGMLVIDRVRDKKLRNRIEGALRLVKKRYGSSQAA